ncbi:hypothetical protein T492DRAFT_943680 [Pavlovales sp. CCMP2436]|nr:hypothetical protein T492DRAFT_943680 [Pavlovales sp. CCMP2436]
MRSPPWVRVMQCSSASGTKGHSWACARAGLGLKKARGVGTEGTRGAGSEGTCGAGLGGTRSCAPLFFSEGRGLRLLSGQRQTAPRLRRMARRRKMRATCET